MAKNKLTDVSTTFVTAATSGGSEIYSRTPEIVDLPSKLESLKRQWAKSSDALSYIFSDSASSVFRVKEIDINLEVTAEGGFRLIASGNVGATTSIRIKLERKD